MTGIPSWTPHLLYPEVGVRGDDGTAGEVDSLPGQVPAESALLSCRKIRNLFKFVLYVILFQCDAKIFRDVFCRLKTEIQSRSEFYLVPVP